MPCSSNEPVLDNDEVSDEEEAVGIWDKFLANKEDVEKMTRIFLYFDYNCRTSECSVIPPFTHCLI